MQSAFIDIGLERAAFCIADIWDARPQGHEGNPNNVPLTPIPKLLFDGQSVTVQVVGLPAHQRASRRKFNRWTNVGVLAARFAHRHLTAH